MSINDLLAFATGAQFAIESNAMVTIDDELAARTGLAAARSGWRCAATGEPTVPSSRSAAPSTTSTVRSPAVGRLLQRHTGPIFPLIEDLFGVSVVEVHQEIAAVLISPELAEGLECRGRQRGAARCSAPTRHRTARSPR